MQISVMDDFDLRILAALQDDARLTNAELADRVGLSASQCSRRKAALEEAGVIGGYHAQLSPETLGLDVTALVQIRLAAHSPQNSRRFAELVARIDEVQDAYAVSGDHDYHLKLVVKDLRALSVLLNDVFLAHDSVAQVHSYVVLDRLKESEALVLPERRRG